MFSHTEIITFDFWLPKKLKKNVWIMPVPAVLSQGMADTFFAYKYFELKLKWVDGEWQ